MTELPELDGLVERLDHVAIAVNDMTAALPFLELLGARFRNGGDFAAGGFRWAQFWLPGTMKLELLQPMDPSDEAHFLVRFLESRGEGVHHLTFKVRDIDTAIARAIDLGFEVVGVNTDGWWKEAFVHPKSAHGVVVQLAQWEDGDPPPERTLAGVMAGSYRV